MVEKGGNAWCEGNWGYPFAHFVCLGSAGFVFTLTEMLLLYRRRISKYTSRIVPIIWTLSTWLKKKRQIFRSAGFPRCQSGVVTNSSHIQRDVLPLTVPELNAYLIIPIQRICRYPILLDVSQDCSLWFIVSSLNSNLYRLWSKVLQTRTTNIWRNWKRAKRLPKGWQKASTRQSAKIPISVSLPSCNRESKTGKATTYPSSVISY